MSHAPWDIPADWPTPDVAARAVSEKLVRRIRDEIEAAGGFLDFQRFMELALYAPGLGYYSAGARKFGPQGDFVTAPEVSALFSRCVARSCASVLAQLGGGSLFELGAGSGALACDLLRELEALDRLPDRYLILERSADLRERQQALVAERLPHLLGRVQWLTQPPVDAWRGMLIANEVVDALPVSLFTWQSGAVLTRGIGWRDDGFEWMARSAVDDVKARVADLARRHDWQGGYQSEFCPTLKPWLKEITATCSAGAALFIDYGYPAREYYHPERAQGTLLCHYRHRAHPDPLRLPGLQDITAHVDFSALAQAGEAAGLVAAGYVPQAHFLLDCGIETLLADAVPSSDVDYLRLASQAKTLMLPGEMGERFKCLLLTRGLDGDVVGFRGRDLRDRL